MPNDKYTLSIHIAAPGTRLFKTDGSPLLIEGTKTQQTSLSGHMFYSLQRNDEKPDSFGFAPETSGQLRGKGERKTEDIKTYLNPAYTRTLEITAEQYEKLHAFGSNPEAYGFDLYYQDVRNNCVDFTWAGLNHADLQRTASIDLANTMGPSLAGIVAQHAPDVRKRTDQLVDDKESFRPMRNRDAVDSIAPPFPDSPLNKTERNPTPERNLGQWLLSEAQTRPQDARDPHHRDHGLDQNIRTAVARTEAEHGRPWDSNSEALCGLLMVAACKAGFTEKDTLSVQLSQASSTQAAGELAFLERSGSHASPDPYANRVSVPTAAVAQADIDTLYERADQQREQALAATREQQTQQVQTQAASGPSLG